MSTKMLVQKNLGEKEFLVQKDIWVKRSLFQKIWSTKLSPLKIGSKKFDKNFVINSWDNADMDKCHQDICCLDKCNHKSWHLFALSQDPLFKVWSNQVSNTWDIAA